MSAIVMISGALFRSPEQRISKSDKVYTTATMRSREGDGSQFWRLVIFSETAQAEVMRLRDGDPLSVTGVLNAGIYSPEGGEPRLSLSIVVDQAIALRPKPRKAKDDDRPKAQAIKSGATPEEAGLDDPLPPW